LRGLWSRKLRTALTFVVVMLGVSLMAGTLVLTDTIRKTFDDLFADVNRGTDVYVRGVTQFESSFGDTQRPRLDDSIVEDIEATDGVAIAEPSVQGYAQIIDEEAEPPVQIGASLRSSDTPSAANRTTALERSRWPARPGVPRSPRTHRSVVVSRPREAVTAGEIASEGACPKSPRRAGECRNVPRSPRL
jgi:hypothetical protein